MPAATMASSHAVIIGAGTLEGLKGASTTFRDIRRSNILTSTRCRTGVVGLAAARRLAALGYRVTVLETESDSDHHTSARGSWVIHSGLYYPPGSLKVCYTHMLHWLCSRHHIPEPCADCGQCRLPYVRETCDDV
jgi:FAD dependent oxidoreductase